MIKSFGDRVLVRILEKEKKQGVLIVPDEKKEFQIGQIVSIGFDLPLFESNEGGSFEVGDYLYAQRFAGLIIEYDGVEYVSLDVKEILAYSKEIK